MCPAVATLHATAHEPASLKSTTQLTRTDPYRPAAGEVARKMWDPRWVDELPARSSEAEDPGYRVAPAVIVDLLPRLSRRKQEIVDMVLFQGLLQREAGERLGITQEAVSTNLKHAYKLLHWYATRPALESDAVVRADFAHFGPHYADWFLAVVGGASYANAARAIGLPGPQGQNIKARVLRFKGLPEQYRLWLETRPSWPCWDRSTRHKASLARRVNGKRRRRSKPRPA